MTSSVSMFVLTVKSVKQGMGNAGVLKTPSAAAEHRSRNREKRASCLSPWRVVCARRVRRAPISARSAGRCRRLRVSFSLVTFSWTRKRKLPAVGQPPTSITLPTPSHFGTSASTARLRSSHRGARNWRRRGPRARGAASGW